jgi:hypothetical protein
MKIFLGVKFYHLVKNFKNKKGGFWGFLMLNFMVDSSQIAIDAAFFK